MSTLWVGILSVIMACAKWMVPPLLGTGEAYTLGAWIEEWAVVVVASVVLRAGFGRSAWWFPPIFFSVAYLAHLPIYIDDKFFYLIFFHGFFVASLAVCVLLVAEGCLTLISGRS